MATLSFNPAQFRDQTTSISYKSLSNISSFPQPIQISCTCICTTPSPTTTAHLSFIKSPSPLSPGRRRFKINSLSESSVEEAGIVEYDNEDDEVLDDPTAELSFLDPATEPNSITEWELDFCSRPILDIRGKKIWELVVCDNSLSLQYTKYFPNNVINSITLKNAIVTICDDFGLPLPEKIRFFRSQLQTIITKACKELGVKPVPSKRCLSLLLWLEERYETIYTRHPGFQKGAKPLLVLDNPFPMELPENLFGERWAFVQLPYSEVQKEVASLEKTFAFGASLDMDLLGIGIAENILIPGLAVASSRAKPLAAWMNGLEVCSIEADTARACLILSVGISTRYIYATYKKTAVTTKEAEAWEAAKKAYGGLHLLSKRTLIQMIVLDFGSS